MTQEKILWTTHYHISHRLDAYLGAAGQFCHRFVRAESICYGQ